jgi:hypothetical protein
MDRDKFGSMVYVTGTGSSFTGFTSSTGIIGATGVDGVGT